ncbi:hypothetical protein HYALB_00013666 [Hymenoscyphus albidus]|uniref:Structure-specific endonuclease subunit SLX4 n=1 Tax=Hymenoscyphus albidus TaxID=595503 RepID=A0A9N9LVA6_9HELO|nr:hypothetical protein HYALB_00013666 [Hymenoscyphus albidus]
MAPADVFILSSSPLQKPFQSHAMSSSPLPSPSELFKQKRPSAIPTGSRAASIPLNSPISFTSAATLLNESRQKSPPDAQSNKPTKSKGTKKKDGSSELLELLDKAKVTKPRAKRASLGKKKDLIDGEPAKVPRKTITKKDNALLDGVETTKPKSSRAKKVVAEDGEEKIPVPRKPRAKKATKDDVGDERAKEKPARKPRAKKSEGGQTKIVKGRVTKKSAAAASDKAEGKLKSISKDSATEKISKPPNSPVHYGLPKAVKRRTDWSPPTASITSRPLSPTSEPVEAEIVPPDSRPSPLASKGFGNLLGDYGSTQSSVLAVQRKVSDEGGTRKRKMIELIKTNISAASNAPVETPPKAKAPRKKARTITDLATSAYAAVESDAPVESAPLLQYFSPTGINGTTKESTKARSKTASKGTKAKKDAIQAPVLLSPTSALGQVRNQDFVFGTSSQLAREESPTYLRDLQMAMQESNQMMHDPFHDSFNDPFADSVPEPSAPAPSKVRRKDPKGALWAAAARDASGSLLDVEVVDLIDSPVVSKTGGILEAAAQLLAEDEWQDVEVVLPKSPTKAGHEPEASTDLQPNSPKAKAPTKTSSPKRPKVLKDKDVAAAPTKTTKKTAKPKVLEMPDFEGFTTVQLASQLASYHFKPVKSRTAMISLLEQCWEGVNRTALQEMATNTKPSSPKKSSKSATEASQSKATTPKKAVGRPRKDSSVSTKASPTKSKAKSKARSVKENEKDTSSDSDIPLSTLRTPAKIKKAQKALLQASRQTSPRRQTKTPPHSLQQLSQDSTIGADLTPASDQATLFKHITLAIKSLPPSRDAQGDPNWQEKILMYDPIVIEDLTAWLNTAGGALEKSGWDAEVEVKEVKKWCEGRGICCLWKENLRGGSRARY